MNFKNFPARFFTILVLACLAFFQPGCSSTYSEKPKATDDVVIDTTGLTEQLNKINIYSMSGDSANCYLLLRRFNNVGLAQQFPGLVYTAYLFSMASTKSNTQKNDTASFYELYNEFYQLALQSHSAHLLTYSELLRAANFYSKGDFEKALPLYLSIAPKFSSFNDRFGYAVASKRIGLIYLNIYKDFKKAAEYLTLAFHSTDDEREQSISCCNVIKCYFKLQNFDSLSYYVKLFQKLPSIHVGYGYNFSNAHYQIYLYSYSDSGSIAAVNKYLVPLIQLHLGQPSIHYYTEFISYFSVYCNALLQKKEFRELDVLIKQILTFENSYPDFANLNSEFYHVCYLYYEALKMDSKALFFLKKYNDANVALNFEELKSKVELARIDYVISEEKIKSTAEQLQKEINAKQQLREQIIIRNALIGSSVLLAILILVLFNRSKLKRTVEMERMRTRLSRDLHDDIGSTLSSINILSRTAQSDLIQSKSEKTKVSLEKINARSQRLLDNIGDIIWNINPGNDSIEEVMSRMREYATGVLESKNINYTFHFPKEIVECKLSMEIKYNVYLVFKEAVNNLCKYSECTHAHLSLTFDEKNIFLKIEDNGKGFEQEEVKHRGGLTNMQYRAKEIKGSIQITSIIGEGTVISLTLPRFC